MAAVQNDDASLGRAHQPAPDSTDKGDDANLERAQYAFARWAIQDDHYLGLYETWAKAILFLLNKQYFRWDPRTRSFGPDTEVPPWRQQPVNPFTYAVFRAALAKLIKQRPVLDVVPPSGDSEDRESARLGEAILQHLHRLLKMSATLKRSLGWFLATGNVYGEPHWDHEAGEPEALTTPILIDGKEVDVPCDENGDPILKEDGTPDLNAAPHVVAQGELGYRTWSPFSVRLNPEASCDEDAYEMFVGELMAREYAAETYGIDASELPTAAASDQLAEYEDLLAGASSGGPDLLGLAGGADRSEAIGERVLVLRYYRDRCDKYPEGRHWIQIGRRHVWPPQGEVGLPNGFWPPLVPLKDTPNPASPMSIGLLQNVVPLNEKYNHLDAKILEHEVTMAMGGIWWTVPEDADIVITSDPAQVRASKGYQLYNRPPIQAELKPLPDAVYEDRDRIQELIELVSGMGAIGLSQKPEGVTSGRGFLVLQEVVDSVFTPSLESFEAFYEEIGRRFLVLVREHYTEERTIAIRGSRGAYEFRSFSGADLTDGLDVRVQAGSAFPWAKSAKLDTAISLVEKMPGLVTDPATGQVDAQKLAKFLDQGGLAAFQSEENADLLEIEREHAMFEAFDPANGIEELPAIGFWQNHAIHQQQHYEFMKRDFARMQRWHPKAHQAFLKHVLETTALLEAMVDTMVPAGSGGEDEGSPGGEMDAAGPGAAPGGAQAPGGSAPAGGRPLRLVDAKASDRQLTPGDRAAAGT